MKNLLVLAVGMLLSGCYTIQAAMPPGQLSSPHNPALVSMPANLNSETDQWKIRGNFLECINRYRHEHELGRLEYDARLNQMAEGWTKLLKQENLYSPHSHNGSTKERRANEVGYYYVNLAENIGRFHSPNGAHIFAQWRDSPAHRAIMLGPLTQLGFACIRAPYGASNTPEYICVADFGEPSFP